MKITLAISLYMFMGLLLSALPACAMQELKNGSSIQKATAIRTLLSLQLIIERYPDAFSELVLKIKDGSHQISETAATILIRNFLINTTRKIQDDVNNILLSALETEGEAIKLENSFKK